MKTIAKTVLLLAFWWTAGTANAQDAAKTEFLNVLPYEGYLTDTEGAPLRDGHYDFTFTLYTSPEGGKPVWAEQHRQVVVTGGLVQLELGNGAHRLDLPFDQPYYLSVRVGSEAEMGPRLKLPTAAYSFRARVADAVPPASISDEHIRSVSWAKIKDVPEAVLSTAAMRDTRLTIQSKTQDNGLSGVPSNVWSLKGNQFTNSKMGFLGTTDDQPLIMKTGGQKRLTIQASGKVDIASDLTVASGLNVGGEATFTTDLTVENDALFGNNLRVGGSASVQTLGVEQSASVGSTLDVTGTTNLREVNIAGKADIQGLAFAQGLRVVGAGQVGPDDSKFVAHFENTDGNDEHGLAIKINNSATSRQNDFIRFYNDGGNVIGRIEGYSCPDVITDCPDRFSDFPVPDFADLVDFSGLFDVGKVPQLSVVKDGKECDGTLLLPTLCFTDGQLPSLNWAALLNKGLDTEIALLNMIEWSQDNGFDGLITTNPFDIALAASLIAAKQKSNDGGVVYSSGGADYAEWLPKLDPEEKMINGQIVGVHGGKITKNTEGADQIMALSFNPIVLGNLPPKGDEKHFQRVGFMGQVPVLVRGRVNAGDFIIPSGKNDGLSRAVAPGDLKLEHLSQILGRAISASNNEVMSLIDVMIGVKTNEWVEIFEQHRGRIETLESRVASVSDLQARVERLEALLTPPAPHAQAPVATSAHSE